VVIFAQKLLKVVKLLILSKHEFLLEYKLEDTSNCGPEWFLEQLLEIIGEFQQAHNNFNQLATELIED
jgi:hypothetical protein